MSSSDSSSSDSEMSGDENMGAIVTKAFGLMKKNLAAVTKSKTQQKNFTNKHRLIYDTFKKTNDNNTDVDNDDDNENGTESSAIDFFIDKGQSDQLNNQMNDNARENDTRNKYTTHDAEKDSDDNVNEEMESSKNTKKRKEKKIGQLSSQLVTNINVNDVYVNVKPSRKKKDTSSKQKHKEPEVMKKSVISEDFEKQDSITTTHTSVRQQKKQRRIERAKTKGGKWFNMPATEITDERKYDLSLLQMRKSLDPKRFYKANDLKIAPKYFQFGEVVADASDFYSSRISKKQRKSTIVEELLADADFRKFNKRKYAEVQDAKRQGKGPYKHMKRLKKAKR